MENQTKLHVHNAASLKAGSIIKLAGNELTITHITYRDDWITLSFNTLWWNPHIEKWTLTYTCNSGFCFEVIQL